MSDGMIGSEG